MRQFIADKASRLLQLLHRIEWLGPLVVRVVFGYFWLETGIAKVHNLDGFTQRFIGWGIPFPAFSAGLSAWTELIGGLLIMLGLFTRLVCVPMLINMAVAVTLVVSSNLMGLDDYVEADEIVYSLIFFWLLVSGPGKASLDTLVARMLGIRPQMANAPVPRIAMHPVTD
ncbi:DoxX family protein [Dyella jiangningensis]|jgi:putative oxidoreductase|uniref:DoxX family protein n=1 Tax=Dyella jiangningensis TaxID=1379159 RepID=UPI002410A63E|nr:DoxX family protein [Dyella jiangningensis]MDG2536365.1 DoxX family protein [Dyella jiangningensis]